MTFRLYSGPQSDGCTAANLVFTSDARPITFTGGPPATGGTASVTYTPTAAGTYHWVESFSGDANNGPVTGACNAPNETSVVARHEPAISTQATNGTFGGAIGDTATITGLLNPVTTGAGAGTATFRLYSGPQSAGCTAANLVFTSDARPITFTGGPPATGGTATVTYTPTTAGTHHWVESFSGDANNQSVTGPCDVPNETSVVARNEPAISTQATNATLGGAIGDTATITGLLNPVTTGAGRRDGDVPAVQRSAERGLHGGEPRVHVGCSADHVHRRSAGDRWHGDGDVHADDGGDLSLGGVLQRRRQQPGGHGCL